MPKLRSGLVALVLAALAATACAPTVRFATSAETAQATRGAAAATAAQPASPSASGPSLAPAIPAPGASPATPSGPATGSGALAQFQATLDKVAAAAQQSVVQINTDSGLGSGIILDSGGNIVTNAHVVAGASSLSVTTADGRKYSASLVGAFAQNDLAVIRASGASELHLAQFADSSTVKVGDVVLAVGSPFGLSETVTEGIVSAVGRSQSEGNGVVLTDLVQTSALINPGNSGGALVNISGQVIGIPTLSGTDAPQRGQASNGIGFAISSNQLVDISRQLIAGGAVTHTGRAYLGVTTRDDATAGAAVLTVVAGGPAAKAGIQAGWVITSVGGHDVADASSLSQVLAGFKPGAVAAVVLRLPDGSTRTVSITLGERPVTP